MGGLETSLYDSTVTQTCYMFLKTHKHHRMKSESWCELRPLGVSGVSVWCELLLDLLHVCLKLDVGSVCLSLNLTLNLKWKKNHIILKKIKDGSPIPFLSFPIALGTHTSARSYFCFFIPKKKSDKILALCTWEMLTSSVMSEL